MQGLCHCKLLAVNYLPAVTECVYQLGKQLRPHTCLYARTQTQIRHIGIYALCLNASSHPPVHTHTRTHKVFHFQIDSRINLKLSSPSFIIQFQPIYIHVPCQSNFSTLKFDIFGNTEHEYSCC